MKSNIVTKALKAGVVLASIAATTPAAQASSFIFAFLQNGNCVKLTHSFNRGDGYRFDLGPRKVSGNITQSRGRPLYEDILEAVTNVTGATYLASKESGVQISGVYGQFGRHILPNGVSFGQNCTGSIADYCGSAEAVNFQGSITRHNYDQIAANACPGYNTGSRFFNAIVEANGTTVSRTETPAPTQQGQTQANGVVMTCSTRQSTNKVCDHITLNFGN